ncbi:MAG: DUF393 domain-containing protein, partial [Flavobacteriaceae bacterium]|nr:DUF393 domain-containing protein [Flavobacteriaceae bacterium]
MSKDLNFKIPKEKKVILFDGICNLCNGSIIQVIKKDTQNIFLFATLQSDSGKQLIEFLSIDTTQIDSIILFEPKTGNYYIKSAAALKIMKEFSGFWKLMQIFTILPHKFNNIFYDFVARNRYKWFGK